jgi:hypothetical protein
VYNKILKTKKKGIKMSKIFIQIAAYRDPELLKTIEGLIENAKWPERLTFGIIRQFNREDNDFDNLDKFKDDKRFKIVEMEYYQSDGVCQIRRQLQEMYSNEKFTLQLDSHHRFIKNWDKELISMFDTLKKKGVEKPLLTAYLPSYEPTRDPEGRVLTPWILKFDRFSPEGVLHTIPDGMPDWQERTEPYPSRFASGHFIFTTGDFCKLVPYDTDYYFHGEEINIAARAYMAGFDLYHPHKVIAWHEYTRSGKRRHWDDLKSWEYLELKSLRKNQEVFGIRGIKTRSTLTKNVRSLREYELYSGVEFSTLKVHKNTLEHKLPPSSMTEVDFNGNLQSYQKFCLDIFKPIIQEIKDLNVLVIAFKDENGIEVYRKDSPPEEFNYALNKEPENKFLQIWRDFYSDKKIVEAIVWPHSESRGWLEIIKIPLIGRL